MVRHQHNRQFFDQLTPKSCYWAGFLAADGNLCPINRGIVTALSEKDFDQVQKLKEALSSTSPILRRDTSNGYREARLSIYGAKECHLALDKNFNITPAKSLTLQPPNLIEEDHVRHFIRGYMDGDGSISKTGKNDHWQVNFIGTSQMLEWIKSQLQRYVTEIGNPSVSPDRNIFIIVFQCKQTKNILDWIYQGSTPQTRLGRKYDRYHLVTKRYQIKEL